MTLARTRLTYRINRFEAVSVVAATVLSVVVSAVVVSWLTQSGYRDCFADELSPRCLDLQGIGRWASRIASMSLLLATFFPIFAGLLIGAPIVARELDRGTARLAWSLSPSRTRWYVQRLLPMLLLVVVAAFAIGVVADALTTATSARGFDPANSFRGFHGRGVLLATSALVMASVAVAVGAVTGKATPTLVLALVLGGLTLYAVSEVHRKVVLAGDVVVRSDYESFDENDLYIDGKFQLPDGRLYTWEELAAIDPSVNETGPNYPFRQLVVPGNRYRVAELREAGAHVAISAIFLVGGGVVVSRRRPG